MEHDDFVDAVEELWSEVTLERLVDLVAHALVGQRFVVFAEANVGLAQILRAQVGCHDQHRVAEVGAATLCVGESTFFENLEQCVEHIWVSFLDFVKQHNRKRLATHGLGKLTAFFVAHVSRRRANQAADGVLLHVFTHVESD